MSQWPSTKASRVLAALLRIGWSVKRSVRGSHRVLARPNWLDVVFAGNVSKSAREPNELRLVRKSGGVPLTGDGRKNTFVFLMVPICNARRGYLIVTSVDFIAPMHFEAQGEHRVSKSQGGMAC